MLLQARLHLFPDTEKATARFFCAVAVSFPHTSLILLAVLNLLLLSQKTRISCCRHHIQFRIGKTLELEYSGFLI